VVDIDSYKIDQLLVTRLTERPAPIIPDAAGDLEKAKEANP
jgi:hypothetical protein